MTQRFGIGTDPSSRAIQNATLDYPNPALTFLVGTADDLPLPDESVDLIYFGFCLYLVDRSLLNKCIDESLRVLRVNGKVLLLDFDPYEPSVVPYRHDDRISTYKDNYEKYFIYRGFCIVAKLSQCESGEIGFEQVSNKRVATFLLSK
jgi:ubiquinone/menaquinone biosynthesis C-methylase UbiE